MKYVYLFSDIEEAERHVGGGWGEVRALLGGKGANLAEMTRLGIPVPPGFTITTEACIAYLNHRGFPQGMWEETLESLKGIEAETGKRFGDRENPLLVSCRSGAKFSMPGMMDTVLNIGLNDETVRGLAQLTGDERFAYDAYRRLVQMFGAVVLGIPDEPFEEIITGYRRKRGVEIDAELTAEDWRGITERFKEIIKEETRRDFPSDPIEQLRLATEAVFKSWSGKRAVDYRNAAGIPHDLGTAVNIQMMAFGNLGQDSGTGVCTTRNITTGEQVLEGDYLINAQGEDVVAGIRRTKPIASSPGKCPGCTLRSRRPAVNWRSTTARSRTWSSPSNEGNCGSSRPATASGRPRPPSVSPWRWPMKA